MNWQPNKWIAALLGFVFQPLGMLYVMRTGWASCYFILIICTAIIEYIAVEKYQLTLFEYKPIALLVMGTCAVHCFKLATNQKPVIPRPWYSKWFSLLAILATFYSTIFLVRSYLYEPFRLPSTSMYPTLEKGSYLIAKKLGYGNYGSLGITIQKSAMSAIIKRGEIVIFLYPKDLSTLFVKRVIGLPGDEIIYDHKTLYLNGKEVSTNYLSTTGTQQVFQEQIGNISYNVANDSRRKSLKYRIKVAAGHYFVMGDNRDNSNDSRYWGAVPEANLVGKVVHVFD
ncbi:MAG: hypothetical protein OFPII_32870 [Osedax symbiont Rs1]|nr:MAG: hypothetical protein OFPII_32870 [Osedax symbiont Rs1]